jgi:cystathionine gamma-synthase
LIGTDAYGGTHRLLTRVHNDRGIRTTAVPYTDPAALEAAFCDGDVAMVWIETPSNPMLTVVDIAAVAAVAHHHGAVVVVDNTFATPYLQQPLTCGADIVVHSSTKYLGGHSDVVGGFAATNDPDLHQRLLFLQNAAGAVPAPFDCYLVLRGVKTLALRMEAHCANAMAVAQWLETHPRIDQVMYPGLASHPTFATAARQMRHPGGMVSCTLRGGEAAARQFVESTRLFCLAESLGAVESLIEHPHSMTHASVVGTGLEVPTNLVRLSVGVEDVADLLADLDQALRA